MLLRLFLTLLDIFDIQTDSLAQLDERLGHVFSEVSDENSANYHVHDWSCDEIGHPELKHRYEQVLLHHKYIFNLLEAIENEELVVIRNKVVPSSEIHVTVNEENLFQLILVDFIVVYDLWDFSLI